jgi:hypothetical protein
MGNNFAYIVLSVPIQFRDEIPWLSLRLGLWLYTGTMRKVEIVGNLINVALSVLRNSVKLFYYMTLGTPKELY